ncbi:transcriptional regulator containing an amidase domain and an AraC-type DNA-binding HTH domain [Pseudomonas asplenii]|uniref:Transcriptional regulator containing an amidase domain and an AraC-type DNA-binding HTH domain n=1 Tax=Pseudomonas asplenii TaxID=53407 RepID=A0A0M9GHM7_9PSED|nr:AraC family transcriptional regulator [Pseudomonas fuscovaginae]KPA91481.1 transcriptional regulator containing an amidase domain and an AraC-type DNA-binding HTH domain [Pseudomonas fuscovaginae]
MISIEASLASGECFSDLQLFTEQNQLFLHYDLDSVRTSVGRIFKPHELVAVHTSEAVGACMHHVTRGGLALSRLEYATEVDIDPGRLEDFYLIQIPIQGGALIRCEGLEFESSPLVASLLSPTLPARMRWQGHSPQLTLRIEQADMAYHCRQHIPQASQRLPQFDPRLDFSRPGAAYFLQLLNTLVHAIGSAEHPLHQPLVLKQFESALLNSLLYGQPHSALDNLERPAEKSISPYFIKRTEAYIREHLHEPLSVESLAEQAGVSVRTLFAGFRSFRNTSPMAYMRELRLERVHEELTRNEQASVTEVAFKWGFAHLGRFAQEYKRRYGELPSATRRFRVS